MPPAIADGWDPSPARRVLTELADFRYLFNDTNYTSFFCLTGLVPHRTALLGFGDPRNAWATANDASNVGCQQVEIDLVDTELINVARGVLLDHLAVVLDVASNAEDALFLWGVMYCLALPPVWLLRLQNLITQLLSTPAAESGINARLPRAEDVAAVREVLMAWGDPAGRLTAAEAQKSRSQHLALWLTRKKRYDTNASRQLKNFWEEEVIDPDWKKSLQAFALHVSNAAECSDAVDECLDYFLTGSCYPFSTEESVGNVPQSEWSANPTLLDPVKHTWHLPYDTCPFLSFLPMDDEIRKLTEKDAEKGNRKALVAACFAYFRALAATRRSAESKISVTMHFYVGDALQFCSSGIELPHGAYSSVDTSTLADTLGLLNVLVLCRPLLKSHPHAALHTSSMAWPRSGAKTLAEYVDKTLGIDLQLAPTLLGVRLLSQVELGREFPRARLSPHVSDTLVWQPAPITPAVRGGSGGSGGSSSGGVSGGGTVTPLPRLEDSAELRKGIKALAKMCNVTPMVMNTSLTLLHLLRGLSERVVGVLPPHSGASGSTSSSLQWRKVAEHTAKLCGLSPEHEMQWQALCCWCFGAQGGWESSNNKRGKDPKETPLLLQWKVKPSEVLQLVLTTRGRHTPIVECKVSTEDETSPEMMQQMMGAMLSGKNPDTYKEEITRYHTFDVIGFNSDTLEATCLLTPDEDHLYDEAHQYTSVSILDTSHGNNSHLSESPVRVRDTRQSSFSRPPPPRLAGAAWVAAETAALTASVEAMHGVLISKAIESKSGYLFFKVIKGGPGQTIGNTGNPSHAFMHVIHARHMLTQIF